jgi:glucose/arabinose dehydrogenase
MGIAFHAFMKRTLKRSLFWAVVFPFSVATAWVACTAANKAPGDPPAPLAKGACAFVEQGSGPVGTVPVHAETVVSGLTVPWSLVFLPNGDSLVTERPGRVRLIQGGNLATKPVLTLNVVENPGTEQGLLGMALHPAFAQNSLFYVYYSVNENGTTVNRLERYTLSPDHTTATLDRIILDGVPSGSVHDGGRIKFGPDGMLYIGAGDTTQFALAQNPASMAGKILRITPDGGIPADNPVSGNPYFVMGIRNVEAFDWLSNGILMIAEHGPTGELNGWTGHDRIEFAQAGDNFGWPTGYGCENGAGFAQSSLSWNDAVPPGGAVIYTGTTIPEWTGNLIVGTLGSTHLHRIVFQTSPNYSVVSHETYFDGTYGRLRDVVQGPDGNLYVTTSNCDGRGSCPADQDLILRIVHD